VEMMRVNDRSGGMGGGGGGWEGIVLTSQFSQRSGKPWSKGRR